MASFLCLSLPQKVQELFLTRLSYFIIPKLSIFSTDKTFALMAPQKLLRKGLQGILALTAILSSCISDDLLQPQADDLSTTTPPITKQVSASQAQDVAKSVSATRFGVTPSMASRSSQTIETISDTDGTPLAYIVNTEGAGWAIVSATTDYYPILAYSDNPDEVFDMSDSFFNESGLSIWMDNIRSAIGGSASNDTLTARQIAMEWLPYAVESPGLPGGNSEQAVACRNRLKVLNEMYYQDGWTFKVLTSVSEVAIPSNVYAIADYCGSPYQYTIIGLRDVSTRGEVKPMTSTLWSQEDPFNKLCNGALAGCIPIAMAQIMKFHKYPLNYNWANMPNSGATIDTQQLIYDIGIAVGIKYQAGSESGASPNDAVNGFKKFGYNATKKAFSFSEVVKEISTYKRPVYLRGVDSDTGKGHAWVCDGFIKKVGEYQYYVEYLNSVGEYTNYGETLMENPGSLPGESYTTLHMNWGWGGKYNGNYIQPSTSNGHYTSNQEAIFVNPNK